MLCVKKGVINYHFLVFGMTRPEIEPQSPGLLANTLIIRPIAHELIETSEKNLKKQLRKKYKYKRDSQTSWYKITQDGLICR